jgi:hypothetical protein
MGDDEIRVTRVDPVRCKQCGKEISREEAGRHQGRCDACAGTVKVSFKSGTVVQGTGREGAGIGACPVCGSTNVSRTYVKQIKTQNEAACCLGCALAPVLWPVLLVLPFLGKNERRGRCGDCGHEWKA